MIGGGATARIGLHRSLWIFGFMQMFSNLVFISLATLGKNYPAMVTCVGVENICGGMGTAAFTAFLISLTEKKFSATQYALLSSVMALTPMFGGAFAGFLARWLSTVAW